MVGKWYPSCQARYFVATCKYDFYEVILEALRSFQLVYLDYNLHCTKTIMVCSELRTSCWALLAQTPDHAADVRFLGKF